MKVSYVQWPHGLLPDSAEFESIKKQVRQESPDILVTNEMPFGKWVAAVPVFDIELANETVSLHEKGIAALNSLEVPLVLSSRPVHCEGRLANEAFALENGTYKVLHHKHYFPSHVGWYEAEWFRTGIPGFEVAHFNGISVGVLLCTELMFQEHARAYGHAGADLIVTPRATPLGIGNTADGWAIACGMAAYITGCYVVTSNHYGESSGSKVFGGGSYAYAPGGEQIGKTNAVNNLLSFELDRDAVVARKKIYPCYVGELK